MVLRRSGKGQSFILGLVLVFFTIATVGCGDSEPTNQNGGTDVLTDVLRVQVPGVGAFMVPNVSAQGVLATFNLHGSTLDRGLQHGNEFAIAAFLDPLGLPTLYVGDVSVNGNLLDTAMIPPSGSLPAFLFYYRPDPTIPGNDLDSVAFDGSLHSWTVEGNPGVGGFTFAIPSVNGDVSVSTPAVLAEVPRTQPFLIQWTGATASDSVLLSVTDNGGTGTTIAALVTGTSHTFSAARMSALAAGSASVEVEKIRFVLFPAAGRTYMMSSASSDKRNILLR
jgi:hypothetical protein